MIDYITIQEMCGRRAQIVIEDLIEQAEEQAEEQINRLNQVEEEFG